MLLLLHAPQLRLALLLVVLLLLLHRLLRQLLLLLLLVVLLLHSQQPLLLLLLLLLLSLQLWLAELLRLFFATFFDTLAGGLRRNCGRFFSVSSCFSLTLLLRRWLLLVLLPLLHVLALLPSVLALLALLPQLRPPA